MTKHRNRLSQVEFTRLVMWLESYEGPKTTLEILFKLANQSLDFPVTKEAINRAVNEFDMRQKLLAKPPLETTKAKLIEKVEMMELLFDELVERLKAIEEMSGIKHPKAFSNEEVTK